MDILTFFFSWVCGQGRCFEAAGQALPVCQRCLGLYLGAAFTGLWIIGTGIRRCGLPPRRILFIEGVFLGAALLGGIHLIDPGPHWRLMCGLWTGHGVAFWLVTGSRAIISPAPTPPWSGRLQIQATIFPVALTGFALSFGWMTFLGWYFWSGWAVLGAASLMGAGVWVLICVACRLRMALTGNL